MKTIQWTSLAGVFAVALLLSAPRGVAQDEPPPPPPEAADAHAHVVPAPHAASAANAATPGAPRGGGDRIEQFRQRMNEFLKTALKVSDEQWAVIQPLLEKVQHKQREALGARFGMFGGRRGGADRPNSPGRPSMPEADALKAALESEAASPADIKTKLEALRESRKKAATELEQAREDLRKVLTQRQEATLVLAGILE